jgi:type I restriction enzyme S subunit
LRFPGFSDEWVKVSLGDIGETLIGLTYSPKDVVANDGTIVFRSSNIQDGMIDYTDLVRVNKPIKERIVTRENDILICARNGSQRLIGKNALLTKADEGNTFGAFMMIYRSDDNDVIHPILSTRRYISQVSENLGARINQITTSDLNSFEFYIPSNCIERRKIGKLFALINERIATQNKIIEDLKKLKSAIRWKIFSDLKNHQTKTIEVGELLAYEQPSPYIVTNDEYVSDSNKIPVLTANKGFILGYTDEPFGIYQKGNCIIFDDFTMDAKYVTFPFKVKSSAIKILTAKPSANLRFMFEYLQSLDLKSEEHKRHYISEVAKMVVSMPAIDMQKNIASILVSIDTKLMIERNLTNRYEEEKQYLLSNMFI